MSIYLHCRAGGVLRKEVSSSEEENDNSTTETSVASANEDSGVLICGDLNRMSKGTLFSLLRIVLGPSLIKPFAGINCLLQRPWTQEL